jgi:hypothetical protein
VSGQAGESAAGPGEGMGPFLGLLRVLVDWVDLVDFFRLFEQVHIGDVHHAPSLSLRTGRNQGARRD